MLYTPYSLNIYTLKDVFLHNLNCSIYLLHFFSIYFVQLFVFEFIDCLKGNLLDFQPALYDFNVGIKYANEKLFFFQKPVPLSPHHFVCRLTLSYLYPLIYVFQCFISLSVSHFYFILFFIFY